MSNVILEKIKELADAQRNECIKWRRHIHAHPELSFHEQKTAAYIHDVLLANGFEAVTRIGDTGVMATLQGKSEGKVILLRADIDALPITEENSVDFISKNPGVMHACGHDAHTAMLLSAASILKDLREEWNGTIKILFQPAEELIPGGALSMIASGVLDNPKVGDCIGQHVMPRIPAGKVGIRPGKFMASADDIIITIIGKGGHAATPEVLIDPVSIAGQVIVSLQQVISRNANPRIPAVLSIGKVIANGAYNVIPDTVRLEGTFRTVDSTWREEGLKKIKQLVENICTAMGAEVSVEFRRGYPHLHNDERLTAALKQLIVEYAGAENVYDEDIWMAAEDFAYYSHKVPSAFYLLGIRNESKGVISGLHTPTFMVDEDALPFGAGLMAWLAFSRMHQ
jgi:amidohydrolase